MYLGHLLADRQGRTWPEADWRLSTGKWRKAAIPLAG